MCKRMSEIASESGQKFHASWCAVAGASAGECSGAGGKAVAKAAPATKAKAPKRHACESVHPGVGHVRWAIADRKASADMPTVKRSVVAAARLGKRARRAQERANRAGLRANAHAAATVATTPPVSAPRVTSGPSRVEPTPVRVPGTPDVLTQAERIVQAYGALTAAYDARFDAMDDKLEAIISGLRLKLAAA